MAKDPIWLEDQLVGIKRGPELAAELNKIPVVGQVVQTVNTVAGLIPANITTTVETTLDAAALAEIRKIALGTLNWFNSKLAAAGLPTQEISVLDGELAAFLKTESGGEVDLTAQFPGSGTAAPAAADSSEPGSADDNAGSPPLDLTAGNGNNPIFGN